MLTIITIQIQDTIIHHLHKIKVYILKIAGFNNNMPPNYGGQQPFIPGQQPMPNLNQGIIKSY